MSAEQTYIDLLALRYIPGIGPVLAKTLIAYIGETGKIFSTKKSHLQKIPGIGEKTIDNLLKHATEVREKAEAQWEDLEKKNIRVLHYLEDKYPKRLKQCTDGPLLLFYKGKTDFNHPKTLAVVGTRRMTDYGRKMIHKLVEDLQAFDIQFISGLAFGVDACVHQECVKKEIQNLAVLGHGLHTLYPPEHRKLAEKIQENGAILSEYTTDDDFNKENFPERNRLIAGMADATIVIETGLKGGSIITAHLAAGYHRDVMALPGRAGDPLSEGCNALIKENLAAMIENATDVIKLMGWQNESPTKAKVIQRQLFVELEPEEKTIMDVLYQRETLSIDDLSSASQLSIGETAVNVLQLELKGLVTQLPGSMVKLS